MFRHFTPSARALNLALTILLFLPVMPASASEPILTADTPTPPFIAKPDSIQVGKTRDVIISTDSKVKLTGFEPQPLPSGSGVTFEQVPGAPKPAPGKVSFLLTDDDTNITVRLKIDEDAELGFFTLTFARKTGDKAEARTAEIRLTEPRVQRAPTPNGISRVDMMWTLLPDGVIKDNFGSKTSKHYYGIQVVIGNNSGFDLQVVSMGFNTTLRMSDTLANAKALASNAQGNGTGTGNGNGNGSLNVPSAGAPPEYKPGFFQIPVLDHRLVRGTIEKEQAFGKRAKILGLVTGFGTLATGFVPYFHALNPKANFSTATSILNGQFKEGFTLAVPDLTVRQLNRLENQVMHDELVVPNNRQERTVVFVPKGIFETDKQKPNPVQVMRILNELVLVGRPLVYFEDREIVVVDSGNVRQQRADQQTRRDQPTDLFGQPLTTPIATLTPAVEEIAPSASVFDEPQKVTITGNGFTPGDVTVIFGNTPTTGVALSPTTIKATVPAQTAPGAVEVTVAFSDTQKIKLARRYTYLDKLAITNVEPTTAPAAGGITVKLLGRGFMNGAQVKFGDKPATGVSVANDGTFIITTAPAQTAAGSVNVTVTQNGKTATLANGFTYSQ